MSARGGATLRYCYERDRLLTGRNSWPMAPSGRRPGSSCGTLSNKVGDLYAPVRPQPLAAK
jgi:hypothetical protein